MPKRTDLKSIMIIGAGPIIIGQACEFDYSGTQACKALKEEGYRVILVNSNPATIMTDPELADATYIEPITPEVVEMIIAKEKPDAILPTMGGQTGLNTALALAANGALERHNVELIGATADAIDKAENRERFNAAMAKLNLEVCKGRTARSIAEAEVVLEEIGGLPAIIRPSFTMGGTGGGVAYNKAEFLDIVTKGLDASPTNEVLVEESILGWKEYEMEVVRDKADNCIIVCSIENVDPMGVHTGDSITVAPALTLTDKEYQVMRNASIAVLREIGVETGGSNVQFAVNPQNGRLIVIEMNPRVSRSSALASKATGFPIAKVAAKLAVGYTLDELSNDITGVTPASFEPTIDYVVTKVPRFTFEKFAGAEPVLSTAMKSVGEVMAVGRNFAESLQKAMRSMETGLTGLNEIVFDGYTPGSDDKRAILSDLGSARPDRLLRIAQAIREGVSLEEINRVCHYEPWFLRQLDTIVSAENSVRENGLPSDERGLRQLKMLGFSDSRLAELCGKTAAEVSDIRRNAGVRPSYKRIDTCAAEFDAKTPYMYSSYETFAAGESAECEAFPSDREKIIILGGGPNRIGQGIEFDYCCCHACFSLSDAGYETIMINCNPETVSTDYDTSDRLYFEPLTAEDVVEIVHKENENGSVKGVIVQFGGQTPLKLCMDLEAAGIPILGTSPDAIDLAEDRERFQELVEKLGLKQPKNGIAFSLDEAKSVAEQVGYPVLTRPSYVLGGRAMEIVHDEAGLENYIKTVTMSGDKSLEISEKRPVLIDSFLQDAIEVDVDTLSDGTNIHVAGIMEHIEEAGIHSGDSACSLPPYSLPVGVVNEVKRQSEALARALNVVGLMNVQFAVKDDEVYLIEVNPRASRTVPFVAKAIGSPVAAIAAQVMAGAKLTDFDLVDPITDHVAVKEVVIPWARFPGVDVLLGPEMKSTGEVMGIDSNFPMAFYKSQLAAGVKLPTEGKVFVSVKDSDKYALVPLVKSLLEMGYSVVATTGTATYLNQQGLNVESVYKVTEGQRPHVLDIMVNGEIQLMFNTTSDKQAIMDSYSLRHTALTMKLPYFTTIAASRAAVQALKVLRSGAMDVKSLQEFAVSK
ncbi:carbamoyl-phosphate synthase (glutamine-hydrolyzing) [Kordiimonas sediminis]|uniref:Carbamoyl phosphate synthase large chain n=1 Tax=Kordiimonas sediminis TaxID=1735581 RepID=A0A919AQ54_9PROT|nr:carbamoyl-phosphate synthase large subunit [Kordiimonas sediminis]GHF19090.1 carbamoyl-phosphate synthase (glutamine-hydrolyzing) [Kordiimonas sediminis]